MINLKTLRKERKLTLSDVATALDTSTQVISRYELGQREPDLETVKKLADFFGVTTDYLLGREDDFGNVSVKNNADLTDEERLILETYRNLPAQRRKTFMLFVQSCNENDVGSFSKFHV